MSASLVGSEMCIRDSCSVLPVGEQLFLPGAWLGFPHLPRVAGARWTSGAGRPPVSAFGPWVRLGPLTSA
eukprot:8505293-Alexandrium_andersonii.AAC.1